MKSKKTKINKYKKTTKKIVNKRYNIYGGGSETISTKRLQTLLYKNVYKYIKENYNKLQVDIANSETNNVDIDSGLDDIKMKLYGCNDKYWLASSKNLGNIIDGLNKKLHGIFIKPETEIVDKRDSEIKYSLKKKCISPSKIEHPHILILKCEYKEKKVPLYIIDITTHIESDIEHIHKIMDTLKKLIKNTDGIRSNVVMLLETRVEISENFKKTAQKNSNLSFFILDKIEKKQSIISSDLYNTPLYNYYLNNKAKNNKAKRYFITNYINQKHSKYYYNNNNNLTEYNQTINLESLQGQIDKHPFYDLIHSFDQKSLYGGNIDINHNKYGGSDTKSYKTKILDFTGHINNSLDFSDNKNIYDFGILTNLFSSTNTNFQLNNIYLESHEPFDPINFDEFFDSVLKNDDSSKENDIVKNKLNLFTNLDKNSDIIKNTELLKKVYKSTVTIETFLKIIYHKSVFLQLPMLFKDYIIDILRTTILEKGNKLESTQIGLTLVQITNLFNINKYSLIKNILDMRLSTFGFIFSLENTIKNLDNLFKLRPINPTDRYPYIGKDFLKNLYKFYFPTTPKYTANYNAFENREIYKYRNFCRCLLFIYDSIIIYILDKTKIINKTKPETNTNNYINKYRIQVIINLLKDTDILFLSNFPITLTNNLQVDSYKLFMHNDTYSIKNMIVVNTTKINMIEKVDTEIFKIDYTN